MAGRLEIALIKPFEYQKKGIEFLTTGAHQKLLADEMGLGKTAQLIWAAQKIQANRIHVICPAGAKYNWQEEFLKFGNIKAEVAGNGHNCWNRPVMISSFEYAKKFMHKYIQYKRDLLIVDEAHLLKEPSAERTKVILGTRGLIHNATRFWAATGTPAPNHAGELWVLLKTFGLTKLSYDGFTARYCTSHHVGGHYGRIQITGSNTKYTPELKALLRQCSLRRLKKDELDLPPMTHNVYYIDGDSDADILKMFPDLKEKLAQEHMLLKDKLGFNWGEVSDERLLGVLNFMAQSISSLRRYHGLKKVKPVAELIRQELLAKEYKKIVIFGIHKDVLYYLKQMLDDEFQPVIITGSTPPLERHEIVERFQNDDNCKIFIGNIQAAGTAITLTAANQVGFIEQDWVPGNNAQAADRTHRIGQLEAVTSRHFAIRDSLDAKITATITRKTKEISTFI